MSYKDGILHERTWNECLEWIALHKESWIRFLPVYVKEMPDKKGGVGWARKLAMDEAAHRLGENGIMVCLDADCSVEANFLEEILQQFEMHPSMDAASIYFEHPFDSLPENEREAIIQYELHLRYLVHAHRWCGHPFAYQTVGSSMAVRRNAYMSQGGMNTKQAGEDFYFLQKFIETGKLFENKGTTVFPSSRISNRVPFGTGKAMQQIQINQNPYMTTHFEIFKMIKPLFKSLDYLRNFSCVKTMQENFLQNVPELKNEVIQYLLKIDFIEATKKIAEQTSSAASFRKRFFRYFNAFRMIKYMHYMRDRYFPDADVESALYQFFNELKYFDAGQLSAEKYLIALRKLDKMS